MTRYLDILGHVGYGLIALGTLLIAAGNSAGWPLRLCGTLTWCFIGWRLRASSIWLWAGLIFGPIEVYGWLHS